MILILLYLSVNVLILTHSSTVSFIVSQVEKVERERLAYFLWSVPFIEIIVFISIFITSYIVSGDFESKESEVLYTLPISREKIYISKILAAFSWSAIFAGIYFISEATILTLIFNAPPLILSIESFLLSLIGVFSIVSLTSFFSITMKNPLRSSLTTILIYFVAMNILNFYFLIEGIGQPLYLLNSDISIISEVYTQVNILPIGAIGSISGAPLNLIINSIFGMLSYIIAFFIFSLIASYYGDIK
ncbi:MAG: ABC transporter permease [Thermoplasmata archaeon]